MKIFVRVNGPRPDFRLVLAFVWGDIDTDTDGDSRNPASNDWTQLSAQSRVHQDEFFTIDPVSNDPLVLEVESNHEWLVRVVAYLLVETTRGEVSVQPMGPFEPVSSLLGKLEDFDLKAAWKRYDSSPFQRSTLDNPYPNLKSKLE